MAKKTSVKSEMYNGLPIFSTALDYNKLYYYVKALHDIITKTGNYTKLATSLGREPRFSSSTGAISVKSINETIHRNNFYDNFELSGLTPAELARFGNFALQLGAAKGKAGNIPSLEDVDEARKTYFEMCKKREEIAQEEKDKVEGRIYDSDGEKPGLKEQLSEKTRERNGQIAKLIFGGGAAVALTAGIGASALGVVGAGLTSAAGLVAAGPAVAAITLIVGGAWALPKITSFIINKVKAISKANSERKQIKRALKEAKRELQKSKSAIKNIERMFENEMELLERSPYPGKGGAEISSVIAMDTRGPEVSLTAEITEEVKKDLETVENNAETVLKTVENNAEETFDKNDDEDDLDEEEFDDPDDEKELDIEAELVEELKKDGWSDLTKFKDERDIPDSVWGRMISDTKKGIQQKVEANFKLEPDWVQYSDDLIEEILNNVKTEESIISLPYLSAASLLIGEKLKDSGLSEEDKSAVKKRVRSIIESPAVVREILTYYIETSEKWVDFENFKVENGISDETMNKAIKNLQKRNGKLFKQNNKKQPSWLEYSNAIIKAVKESEDLKDAKELSLERFRLEDGSLVGLDKYLPESLGTKLPDEVARKTGDYTTKFFVSDKDWLNIQDRVADILKKFLILSERDKEVLDRIIGAELTGYGYKKPGEKTDLELAIEAIDNATQAEEDFDALIERHAKKLKESKKGKNETDEQKLQRDNAKIDEEVESIIIKLSGKYEKAVKANMANEELQAVKDDIRTRLLEALNKLGKFKNLSEDEPEVAAEDTAGNDVKEPIKPGQKFKTVDSLGPIKESIDNEINKLDITAIQDASGKEEKLVEIAEMCNKIFETLKRTEAIKEDSFKEIKKFIAEQLLEKLVERGAIKKGTITPEEVMNAMSSESKVEIENDLPDYVYYTIGSGSVTVQIKLRRETVKKIEAVTKGQGELSPDKMTECLANNPEIEKDIKAALVEAGMENKTDVETVLSAISGGKKSNGVFVVPAYQANKTKGFDIIPAGISETIGDTTGDASDGVADVETFKTAPVTTDLVSKFIQQTVSLNAADIYEKINKESNKRLEDLHLVPPTQKTKKQVEEAYKKLSKQTQESVNARMTEENFLNGAWLIDMRKSNVPKAAKEQLRMEALKVLQKTKVDQDNTAVIAGNQEIAKYAQASVRVKIRTKKGRDELAARCAAWENGNKKQYEKVLAEIQAGKKPSMSLYAFQQLAMDYAYFTEYKVATFKQDMKAGKKLYGKDASGAQIEITDEKALREAIKNGSISDKQIKETETGKGAVDKELNNKAIEKNSNETISETNEDDTDKEDKRRDREPVEQLVDARIKEGAKYSDLLEKNKEAFINYLLDRSYHEGDELDLEDEQYFIMRTIRNELDDAYFSAESLDDYSTLRERTKEVGDNYSDLFTEEDIQEGIKHIDDSIYSQLSNRIISAESEEELDDIQKDIDTYVSNDKNKQNLKTDIDEKREDLGRRIAKTEGQTKAEGKVDVELTEAQRARENNALNKFLEVSKSREPSEQDIGNYRKIAEKLGRLEEFDKAIKSKQNKKAEEKTSAAETKKDEKTAVSVEKVTDVGKEDLILMDREYKKTTEEEVTLDEPVGKIVKFTESQAEDLSRPVQNDTTTFAKQKGQEEKAKAAKVKDKQEREAFAEESIEQTIEEMKARLENNPEDEEALKTLNAIIKQTKNTKLLAQVNAVLGDSNELEQ